MKRFKNILIDVTGSDYSKLSLSRFFELADRNSAKLTMFTSIEQPNFLLQAAASIPVSSLKQVEDVRASTAMSLRAFANTFASDKVKPICVTEIGTAAISTVQFAQRHGCDLIVIPRAEDGSFNNVHAGKLMRKSPCPVWIGNSKQMKSIGVCVDPRGSEGNQLEVNKKSLEMATSMAAWENVPLHVIAAWNPMLASRIPHTMNKRERAAILSNEKKLVENSLEKLLAESMSADCQMEVHLERGPAARVIPQTIEELDIDLVVMGNLAKSGVAGYFIGNTAEQIISKVEKDILTMKYSGFVSPVR